MQHGFLAGYHQGMAGVMAALETHHALRMIGQPIDYLALAFITPLSADHHYILSHYRTFEFEKSPI